MGIFIILKIPGSLDDFVSVYLLELLYLFIYRLLWDNWVLKSRNWSILVSQAKLTGRVSKGVIY
jgi:hypothetical protein